MSKKRKKHSGQIKPKSFAGQGQRLHGNWIAVKYKLCRDAQKSVLLTLHNGEDILVNKTRAIVVKTVKKIYIEPNYYNRDFKHIVESED